MQTIYMLLYGIHWVALGIIIWNFFRKKDNSNWFYYTLISTSLLLSLIDGLRGEIVDSIINAGIACLWHLSYRAMKARQKKEMESIPELEIPTVEELLERKRTPEYLENREAAAAALSDKSGVDNSTVTKILETLEEMDAEYAIEQLRQIEELRNTLNK